MPVEEKYLVLKRATMSHLLPRSKNTPEKQQRALSEVKYEKNTIDVYGAKNNFRPRHPPLLQPEKTKSGNLN